jgi:hypothetical protein
VSFAHESYWGGEAKANARQDERVTHLRIESFDFRLESDIGIDKVKDKDNDRKTNAETQTKTDYSYLLFTYGHDKYLLFQISFGKKQ